MKALTGAELVYMDSHVVRDSNGHSLFEDGPPASMAFDKSLAEVEPTHVEAIRVSSRRPTR